MSETFRAIGFAPGTAAIWAALLFGVASIAAYLRSLSLETSGAPPAAVAAMTGFARRSMPRSPRRSSSPRPSS